MHQTPGPAQELSSGLAPKHWVRLDSKLLSKNENGLIRDNVVSIAEADDDIRSRK